MAFSAFTDFGAVMALAIAVHNIPEGVIVAAPVYAATGSRWKAMGIAVASVRAPTALSLCQTHSAPMISSSATVAASCPRAVTLIFSKTLHYHTIIPSQQTDVCCLWRSCARDTVDAELARSMRRSGSAMLMGNHCCRC